MPVRHAAAGALIGEQQTSDDAGGDRYQHVVTAGLHPLVATRRRIQMVATPVVDHILAIAIFRWQTAAFTQVMTRAGATVVVTAIVIAGVAMVIAAVVTAVILAIVGTVVAALVGAAEIWTATAVVITMTVLRRSCAGHANKGCQHGSGNQFAVHVELLIKCFDDDSLHPNQQTAPYASVHCL